jgi:nucleotide-binding universal stress UspA family protein
MFGRVLVPADGSGPAEHAVALAAATGAAVHVVSLGTVWEDAGAGRVIDAFVEAAKRAIDRVVDRAEAAGFERVEAGNLRGALGRGTVGYADLVPIGTHGRTGLERFLPGSVTERVVRPGETPVLAVPRAPDG